MVKIVFVMEYMDKLLKEIGYPVSIIIENSKNDYEVSGSFLKGLKTRIGDYDFNNLGYVDYQLNTMLLDEDQDYDSVFHNPNILANVDDREKNNALQNSLATANPKSFEETYSIEVTTEGNFIIKVNEGFMNYIGINGIKKYNKVLLGEIINYLPRKVLMSNEAKRLMFAYKKLL